VCFLDLVCEAAVTLFLFSDDVEEFLIVAHDREDAFRVIEEHSNAETADELAASVRVDEYPPEFVFPVGDTAAEIVEREGRGVFAINCLDGKTVPSRRFPKPVKVLT
jgi:hypothetical protein